MLKREKKPPTNRIPSDPACFAAESWPVFFSRIDTANDLLRLTHFWWTWPGRWAAAVPDVDRCLVLESQYDVATRCLVAEVERHGMDSTALLLSAKMCRETLTENPSLGNWPEPGKGTWPECLEGAKKKVLLRPDQEMALAMAPALLGRLAVVGKVHGLAAGNNFPAAPVSDGLVSTTVAVQDCCVSRATLKRYREEGRLRGYRRPGAPPKSPFFYSKRDLEALFPRKKKPAE